MVVGHGVDVVDVEDFERLCRRDGFLQRCFTPGEQRQSGGRTDKLAARFAAKEAVLKALNLGIINGVALTDVEIQFSKTGSPEVKLEGLPQDKATELKVTRWLLSLTHSRRCAMASAIAESN